MRGLSILPRHCGDPGWCASDLRGECACRCARCIAQRAERRRLLNEAAKRLRVRA